MKSLYEKPEIIALNGPAKGSGDCAAGSAHVVCTSGFSAADCSGGLDASAGAFCLSGGSPVSGCSNGTALTVMQK